MEIPKVAWIQIGARSLFFLFSFFLFLFYLFYLFYEVGGVVALPIQASLPSGTWIGRMKKWVGRVEQEITFFYLREHE